SIGLTQTIFQFWTVMNFKNRPARNQFDVTDNFRWRMKLSFSLGVSRHKIVYLKHVSTFLKSRDQNAGIFQITLGNLIFIVDRKPKMAAHFSIQKFCKNRRGIKFWQAAPI